MAIEYNTKAFLERIGLSQNEIKLYYAALELGECSVTELAKHANVHRVAAYPLIDSLVTRGLFSQTSTQGGKIVAPNHPRQIKTVLNDQKRALRKLELKYEDVLPELSALYKQSGVRPRVTFYDGLQGLKQMSIDVIETMKEFSEEERIIFSYANPNRVVEVFEGYLKDEDGVIPQRKEFGIFNRAIAHDGPATQDLRLRDEEELREMYIIPPELFPFKNDITIYSNKIGIRAMQHEFIGVIIESEEIVADQRAIFELAWLGAKALSEQ